MLKHIPDQLLARPIEGLHLKSQTLSEELSGGSYLTLLVFLRHFGCIFCRELLRDIKKHADQSIGSGDFPRVLAVCQASVPEATDFFARIWPTVPVICDPQKALYNGMQVGNGSISQMFGPRVWACGLRATLKGNTIGIGKIVGDPWTMPGLFLLSPQGHVLWQHHFEHAGDHPNFSTLCLEWKALARSSEQRPVSPFA